MKDTNQTKCSCERPDDNTCDHCESKESEEILKEAKKRVKIKIDEALYLNSQIGNFGKPQQETLEEAASRYACGWGENDDERGFIAGAKWQQQVSQQVVPFDAYNIEIFAIKPDEQGKLFAYIGYKIANGNFHFSAVPFTEPQERYSEEEVNEIIAEAWNSCEDNEGETFTEARKRILEQIKKKQ